MRILALDLGTKTGWAQRINGRVEHGVQDFSLRRGESKGMVYLRFNSWLHNTFRGLELIVYEQTHNRGGAATETAAGFSTRVQEHCANCGIEYANVHTGTLKKFWTGSGSSGKPEMIRECERREFNPEDDNAADAIAILHWAEENYGATP